MSLRYLFRVYLGVFLSCISFAARSLPGDVLIHTATFTEPDNRGIWYLGGFAGGHLYLCDGDSLSAFPEYEILDADARTGNYYLVMYEPPRALTPAEVLFEPVPGRALVRLEPSDAARFVTDSVGREIKKLQPVTARFLWKYAEPPPEFTPEIASAVSGIDDAEISGYISTLQDFETRYSYSEKCGDAGKWLAGTFDSFGLSVTLDEFFGSELKDVFAYSDGNKSWLCGSEGKIYYTSDGGISWETTDTGTHEVLSSVVMLDDVIGYATGSGGTILHTIDGTTWTAQSPPYNDWISGIAFADYDYGCAVCGEGVILYTDNGGATWDIAETPTYESLADVSFGTANTAWAVGANGIILKTDDRGAGWYAQDTPTGNDLNAVNALDGDEVWAVGGAGTVLFTADGGADWTRVYVGTNAWLSDIDFVNKDVGYIVGEGGRVFKTDDGGESWRLLETPTDAWYEGVSFIDAEIGYVVGDNSLVRTTDGETFEEITSNIDDQWTNVIGEKLGELTPDETVIVSAHYDSVSNDPYVNAPGADGNASGVAAVLAAAGALSDLPTERTIKFACFAGGEQGLLGSYNYAQDLAAAGEHVVGVINLDMVGYDEESGARDDSSLVSNSASDWLAGYYLSCDALYNSGLIFDFFTDDMAISSDHSSFWDAGYAAVFLIEGAVGQGGFTDYPYYHTGEDTLDKLTVKLNTRNARASAAAAAHLARFYEGADGPPGNIPIAYPNPVRLYAGDSIVTFDRLTPPVTISVFDITGELVFTREAQNETLTWDLTSENGRLVASGVYIWRVKADAGTTTGKLAVIK